jgi:hypothetical protein
MTSSTKVVVANVRHAKATDVVSAKTSNATAA